MGKKKRRAQPLPTTSATGRAEAARRRTAVMRQDLAALPPETIVHVGADTVMTEEALQQMIKENAMLAQALLDGDDSNNNDEDVDLYEMTRGVLGLHKKMTASELLALFDQHEL